MTSSARTPSTHHAAEAGFAMFSVIIAMMVVLTVTGALAGGALSTTTGVNTDANALRAFQAAEAGAQTALHRINLIQPETTKCVGTTAGLPQTGTGWCAPTAPESVGTGGTFTYQTSVELTSGCTGSSFGTGTSERCVVATGSANGVIARVILRLVSSSGGNPFPVAGILGLDAVTVGGGANANLGIGTNGLVTVGNNSTIGDLMLWDNAPNAVLGSGVTAGATVRGNKYILSPPNMLNPANYEDSSTSNDNGRLLAGASPADSCSGGNGSGGTCYTDTPASPRTLSFANNGSATLGGGVYNFCSINLGNNGQLNIATGATVLIYLDSPDRPGSGCAAGQGGMTLGNDTSVSNPSGDPTKFQLVVYGSTAHPEIAWRNNVDVVGAIYAPNTTIDFKNNAGFKGGVTAKKVFIKNNGEWDARVQTLRFATTLIYFRGSWQQCNSRVQPTTAPATGCL